MAAGSAARFTVGVVRRLVRFLGRSMVRLVLVALAAVFVAAPVAAFTARDVSGPWTPVNGVCYRRVQRIAFERVVIDEHFAIGSAQLCQEPADAEG
jgi:transketolase C-terminal domain/subunit